MTVINISFPTYTGPGGQGPALLIGPINEDRLAAFRTFCGGKSLEILDLNKNINDLDPRPPFKYGLIFWVKKYNPTDQEVSDGQGGHLHLGYDIQETYNHVRGFANRFFGASSISVNTDGLKALVRGQEGLEIEFIPLESRTAGALLQQIEGETHEPLAAVSTAAVVARITTPELPKESLFKRIANQCSTLFAAIGSAFKHCFEAFCLKCRWIR
jgi:hypothetical protein